MENDSLPIFYGIIVSVGYSIDKCWKSKGYNVEKPLIKEVTTYMPKKFKHAIIVKDNVKDIENDEYVNVKVNDILNADYIDLNKVENHTL